MTLNCGQALWFCPITNENYCPTSLCNLKCLCVHEMWLCFVKRCVFLKCPGTPKCHFVPWNVLMFSRKLLCSLKCLVVFCETWGFVQWHCVLVFFLIKLSETLCVAKCRHVSQNLAWYVVFFKMLLGFCCVRAVLGSFSFSTPRLVGWRMSYAVCRLWIHLEADLWYWPIWIKLTWT